MVREFATNQKTHEKLLRSPNPSQGDASLFIVRPPLPYGRGSDTGRGSVRRSRTIANLDADTAAIRRGKQIRLPLHTCLEFCAGGNTMSLARHRELAIPQAARLQSRSMKPDDKICYCYHVSLRKLYHFAKREAPARPSQLSDCLGAGTGCGWCIPILMKIHERVADGWDLADGTDLDGLPATGEEYASARSDYLASDKKNKF